MARKSPAFSFYPDSWIGGTALMDVRQCGIYINLLSLQWLHGPLKNNERLANLVGAPTEDIQEVLELKFLEATPGRWINERLEVERKLQQVRADAGRKGAKKTNEKRWGDDTKDTPPQRQKAVGKTSGSVSDSVSDSVSVSDSDLKSNTHVLLSACADVWNSKARSLKEDGFNSYSEIRGLTKSRKAKLSVRLKEPGWFETFQAAVDMLPIKQWGDWVPDFNWLIKNDTNATELAEGKFHKKTFTRDDKNKQVIEGYFAGTDPLLERMVNADNQRKLESGSDNTVDANAVRRISQS